MRRDRLHDLKPFVLLVYPPYFSESFVNVRYGCYERSPCPDRAANGLPVERISPAKTRVPRAAAALQNLQEVNRPVIIRFPTRDARQEGEPHRVMCVCYRESLSLPEKPPSGGNKCLAEYNRGHSHRPQHRTSIVESLRTSRQVTCVECLKVPRSLAILIQPVRKLGHRLANLSNPYRISPRIFREVNRCCRLHVHLDSGAFVRNLRLV